MNEIENGHNLKLNQVDEERERICWNFIATNCVMFDKEYNMMMMIFEPSI